MFGLNPWEIGLIVLAILLLFGAKRVPELMRAMGKGIREFKTSVEGKDEEEQEQSSEKSSEDKAEPVAKS